MVGDTRSVESAGEVHQVYCSDFFLPFSTLLRKLPTALVPASLSCVFAMVLTSGLKIGSELEPWIVNGTDKLLPNADVNAAAWTVAFILKSSRLEGLTVPRPARLPKPATTN